ncbi:hypothetical protein HPP92_003282 [Vanilla planifolia]|uniref:Uncharacterized protein n=1 Tax=Vanilla planifolia TaxID=51239 RepID=A0A835VHF5_VANPL|nr:hypothetical protein HPP92_003673 [Vanilla planifolia]KAG0503210.1 hypothetical protein HPP92_003282 [Vanilla planifolia]
MMYLYSIRGSMTWGVSLHPQFILKYSFGVHPSENTKGSCLSLAAIRATFTFQWRYRIKIKGLEVGTPSRPILAGEREEVRSEGGFGPGMHCHSGLAGIRDTGTAGEGPVFPGLRRRRSSVTSLASRCHRCSSGLSNVVYWAPSWPVSLVEFLKVSFPGIASHWPQGMGLPLRE